MSAIRSSKGWPIVGAALCVALAVLAVHWLSYPEWNQPEYMAGDEFLMDTNDAYAWLAGAKGEGIWWDAGFSHFTRFLSSATGAGLGDVGFFTPLVFAALVGVVAVLWCWTLGCIEMAVLAGVLTALSPGFFVRSGFGYFDTDIVTLLFPLTIIWMTAHWMRPLLANNFLEVARAAAHPLHSSSAADKEAVPIPRPGYWWLIAPGLLAWLGVPLHHHFYIFANGFIVGMALTAVVCAKSGQRLYVLLGSAVYALCLHVPLVGAAAAVGLTFLARRVRFAIPRPGLVMGGVLCLLVIFLATTGIGDRLLHSFSIFVSNYAKPAIEPTLGLSTTDAGELTFPGILQAVVEATNLSLVDTLHHMHPWAWVSILGFAGFCVTLFFRPSLVLLLPFAIISLASVTLGARMSMFGGIVVGLGVAWPVHWLLQRFSDRIPYRRLAPWGISAVLSILLLFPTVGFVRSLPPSPAIEAVHARALLRLREIAPESAMVWTWWDYGYATNYFAERRSFANGAKQDGRYIQPLAKIMTTDNPLLSNQFMHYLENVRFQPWKAWEDLTPDELQEIFHDLGNTVQEYPSKLKHYLVVSSEYLPRMEWITYFGSWDFATRMSRRSNTYPITSESSLNTEEGILTVDRSAISLESFLSLSRKQPSRLEFPNGTGQHAIYFPIDKSLYMLDDLGFDSMMVQLLIADIRSEEFKRKYGRYFRIVVDAFPKVRIYEVKKLSPLREDRDDILLYLPAILATQQRQ